MLCASGSLIDGSGCTGGMPFSRRHLYSQKPLRGSSSLRRNGSRVAWSARSWNRLAYAQSAKSRAMRRGIAKNQPSASSYGPSYVALRLAGSPGARERANCVRPHRQSRHDDSHLSLLSE